MSNKCFQMCFVIVKGGPIIVTLDID